jgi:hypothetical protein
LLSWLFLFARKTWSPCLARGMHFARLGFIKSQFFSSFTTKQLTFLRFPCDPMHFKSFNDTLFHVSFLVPVKIAGFFCMYKKLSNSIFTLPFSMEEKELVNFRD